MFSTDDGRTDYDRPIAVTPQGNEDSDTATKEAAPAVFTVPDGGIEAWSVIFGGFLAFFATFGYVTSFGVYQAYYTETLHVSQSAVSWIGSLQLWFEFATGIVTGRLFDNGHGRLLMFSGTVIYVFSIFMTSLCQVYWQVILSQGIVGGIGLGLLFLPGPSVVPHWFAKRRALATGVMVTGSSVGGVVFPIMLNHLLPRIGYAQTVRASGYLVLGCLVISCALIRPRIPGRKKRPAHMQFPAPDMKAIVTHKAYLFTILGGAFIMFGVFYPQFYIQVYAEAHGLDSNISFYLLPILNGASVFGRTLPNLAADRFGAFNMEVFCCTATAVVMFCWLPAKSEGALIAFAICYGFFSGAYISLLPACLQSLSSHLGETGVRQGLAWAVIAFAALGGAPIDGALLGPTLTWWRPVVFSGVMIFAGAGFIFIARRLHAAERGHARV